VPPFAGNKDPPPGARVVYIDGGWDMFHAGHIRILEIARQKGDYLIVGVHNDAVVNKQYGSNYPILNMQVEKCCRLA
jgi:ethanolamine-phosphate cytidylyltransferase